VNPADALAAIDAYKTEQAPALHAALKDTAKQMPRCFCVMVYEETYDVNTNESKVDWKNYRVLVGKQEHIDTIKAKIEETVKGDFEVVLREHAI